MEEKTQVVAAVVWSDGKFLLGKRSPHKKSAPHYWCPLSGRIEPGETQQEAVVRECWEEAGIRVRALKKVGEINTDDRKGHIHWWLVELMGGKAFLKNDEHSELGWFGFEELLKLEPVFTDDIDIFKAVVEEKFIPSQSAIS